MLVKWGSIIVKGSGKLGGHVFSSGPNGASVHTLARARNPQSKYQMDVRLRFTKFTQGWRDLTETQRESWYEAESAFSKSNRFGDIVSLSGKNLYESLNTNRAIIGLGVLNTAPLPKEYLQNIVKRVEISISGSSINIIGDFVGATEYVIVASPVLSQGVRSFDGKLKIIGLGESSAGGGRIPSQGTQYSNYVKKFGELDSNGKVFVGTYSINSAGQKSNVSAILGSYV